MDGRHLRRQRNLETELRQRQRGPFGDDCGLSSRRLANRVRNWLGGRSGRSRSEQQRAPRHDDGPHQFGNPIRHPDRLPTPRVGNPETMDDAGDEETIRLDDSKDRSGAVAGQQLLTFVSPWSTGIKNFGNGTRGFD